MMKITIEEFSRLQDYMIACDKNSDAYKLMKTQYHDLKAILSSSDVNLTDIDRVKE